MQQQLNVVLWEKTHKLEFMLLQQKDKQERDERRFVKKLVRLAKYLELKGLSGHEVAGLLRKTRDQDHAFEAEYKHNLLGSGKLNTEESPRRREQ